MCLCIFVAASNRNARKFRVALDIEGCVDRFYGGYYSGMILIDFNKTYCSQHKLFHCHTIVFFFFFLF